MPETPYIIRGGLEGRERLRLIARVMRPTTLSLFERVGIKPAMHILDIGCGGGDVTCDLARLMGAGGKVIGLDMDAAKIQLARHEAAAQGLGNVTFQSTELNAADLAPEFDIVYARFFLTHLPDPLQALATMHHALKPGGTVVVEDIDFTGHFCHPDSAAFRRYVELYTRAVQLRGADPNIGPRLPGMLLDAGFERVQMK